MVGSKSILGVVTTVLLVAVVWSALQLSTNTPRPMTNSLPKSTQTPAAIFTQILHRLPHTQDVEIQSTDVMSITAGDTCTDTGAGNLPPKLGGWTYGELHQFTNASAVANLINNEDGRSYRGAEDAKIYEEARRLKSPYVSSIKFGPESSCTPKVDKIPMGLIAQNFKRGDKGYYLEIWKLWIIRTTGCGRYEVRLERELGLSSWTSTLSVYIMDDSGTGCWLNLAYTCLSSGKVVCDPELCRD